MTASDYDPFGMQLDDRQLSSSNYRFGFNSKENDPEVEGQQDYGFRIYDKRIGRFKSVDPLTKSFPFQSSYVFASNIPIKFIDREGGFTFDDFFKNKYENIAKYLSSYVENDVRRSESIVHNYQKLFYNLTDGSIYEQFKDKSGYKISAHDYPEGQSAVAYTDKPTNTIQINTRLLDYIENTLKSDNKSNSDKEQALVLLNLVLVHETTHVFEQSGYENKPLAGVGELGYYMEKITFDLNKGHSKENEDKKNILDEVGKPEVVSMNDKLKEGVIANIHKKLLTSEKGKSNIPTVPKREKQKFLKEQKRTKN